MFGFIFGTLCLFGLFGMMMGGHRRRRMAWASGGCGPEGYHGHHGRRGQRGRRMRAGGVSRAATEVLKRRLDVDDEQSPIVDHALTDVRKALEALKEEANASRETVADAFRGEEVDDAALTAAFTHLDDVIARERRAIISALSQVHAVLDDEQREAAAELLAHGPSRWS